MSNKFDDIEYGSENLQQELVQCPLCRRRMRPDVFTKHPNVCSKNSSNKRTVFDMTKHRSIRAGDQIIPAQNVSIINDYNNIARPSQTRCVKRDRHSDAFVPPVINNFCMYTMFLS